MKKIAADNNYRVLKRASSNPNEDECANALQAYLGDAARKIFDMWSEGEYKKNCTGTNLEEWHHDLVMFLQAVQAGRAQLPKRSGSLRK